MLTPVSLFSLKLSPSTLEGNLPKILDKFFESVIKKHNYKTRLASRTSYYLPKVRTNYGKFIIRFAGVKEWNLVNEKIKSTPSLSKFKYELKKSILESF